MIAPNQKDINMFVRSLKKKKKYIIKKKVIAQWF